MVIETTAPDFNDTPRLPRWTSTEREDFFSAIARHRRAAWQVTLISHGANFAIAVIVALLMSPLLYMVAGLAFDVINLFYPTATLLKVIGSWFTPLFEAPDRSPLKIWLVLGAVAAAPGLAWMFLVVTGLRRVLQVAATYDSATSRAREPNATLLAEQRLVNVIAEMAIAASLPPPRVLIAEAPIFNAAVFGRDEASAVIVVSSDLLRTLNRNEIQGVAAHLIASIANGDMRAGLQAATTLSLFGLLNRLSTVLTDRVAFRPLWRMTLVLLRPTRASAEKLVEELSDPDARQTADPDVLQTSNPDAQQTSNPAKMNSPPQESARKGIGQLVLWLPLAGPVVLTGLFVGLVSLFALGPLMALVWRRRKYLADATAVRLTRDPDTLAGALQKMGGAQTFATWATHLCVVGGSGNSGFMKSSMVSISPALPRRLRALAKLGAHVKREPRSNAWIFLLIMSPLYALAGGVTALACFALASIIVPVTMMFTGIPYAMLHWLLRRIAGSEP